MTNTLKDAIKNNDALAFQSEFAKILADKLNDSIAKLSEEFDSDPGAAAALEVEMAVKSFGGGDFVHHTGVIMATLRSKQAAEDFSDWLEECKNVDTYEMSIIHSEADVDVEDDIDFDAITDDRNFLFEFTIYLNPEIVSFNDFEYEPETEDAPMVTELFRKARVNFRGVKTIKIKCGRGFKYNSAMKTCQKITGDLLIHMRRAIKKAVLTKKAAGASFMKRVLRKRTKAMKFRHAFGLK